MKSRMSLMWLVLEMVQTWDRAFEVDNSRKLTLPTLQENGRKKGRVSECL